jgi:hypothetical protein
MIKEKKSNSMVYIYSFSQHLPCPEPRPALGELVNGEEEIFGFELW